MIATLQQPAFTTARLAMRPLAPSDGPRLAELANDYEVVKGTGGMPFPYTLADAERSFSRAETLNPDREAFFALDLAGEGPIGTLGFYASGELAPEVGYWLGRAYWGMGLATEALAAAMAWSRDGWGQRYVLASHHADNPASGAVLMRCGFLYTGHLQPRPCRAQGCDVMSRWMAWLA